jgi:putative transposase
MAKRNDDIIGQLLQEVFQDRDGMKRFLEAVVNQAMQGEVAEHLAAEPHQRTGRRKGYRNGVKSRTLSTRVGPLALEVPQTRDCQPYHPSMFARWQRSERALLIACAEMYFQGVSTRKVQNVLEQMCEGEISSATVSRIASELDEKLSDFRRRSLKVTEYPYLHIDARYEKVRVDSRVVSQAVLVAVGFTADGRREVLDWRIADSESQETWGQLFRELKDRGLTGLHLVVSDAHRGIRAAVERHFQGVAWQRCRVHFKREMGRKVSYKQLKALMKDLASVFAGENRAECLRRGDEMAAQWQGRYPAVAQMLQDGLEDCLTVLDFPECHRRRLASTNMLENLMKRLKARTKVVGVFPNRSSCDRLIGSLLLEVHEQWAVEDKAYFNMDAVPADYPWTTAQSINAA